MGVYYNQSSGQYCFGSSDKQWQVYLFTPAGRISGLFDAEQDIDGLLPSDVLSLIEARIKSYWIYTRKEKALAKIAAIREREQEFDVAWMDEEIRRHEKAIADLQARRDVITRAA